ncbi:hypothetical protein BDZ97DRAFT_1803991 [Flammula alnicola]|nr:hypothetical protein BDZ97DRAFT_1803991 [Flammula alnicola]
MILSEIPISTSLAEGNRIDISDPKVRAGTDIFGNSTATRPPISNLDADLLWNIEDEEDFDFPALHTLRRASQVCVAWRNLIIASPSLWGRVINFNFLRQQDWRNEVMRRTAGSWLFVRGSRAGVDGIVDVIICLLAENWSRVRCLTLDLFHIGSLFNHDSCFWRLLKRPADVLVSFQLTFHSFYENTPNTESLSPPDFMIFDNIAPALRSFCAPNIKFDIRAPWTQHIRRLGLSNLLPISQLLEALKHMPLLEVLEDQHSSALTYEDATVPLPHVTLPGLKEIIFRTEFDIHPYMTFLAHLTPAQGVCLSFSATPFTEQYIPHNQAELATAGRILSTYSRSFGLSASDTIHLVLLGYQFKLTASLPTGRSFSFNLDCTSAHVDWEHPEDMLEGLIEEMTFPSFPSARTIYSIYHLRPILATTAETLRFLLDLPNEILKIALPLVKGILVDCPRTVADVLAIQAFLASRIEVGRAVSFLALEMRNVYGSVNMRFLEANTGLEVMICFDGETMRDYVCGSGNPDELIIKRPDTV